ncbi:MAG: hypothetical protein A2Z34_03365 [Planctomycetes bacterium RBG_16_59_8]|nr:MAG: hypothetical protein A2Z34_03365 [Planctomycetes bacterium RBG_16_59_8]
MSRAVLGLSLTLLFLAARSHEGFDPNLGVKVDQGKVDAAIKKATDYLLGKQGANGAWPEVHYARYGTTALTLLALLESDVDRNDPRIKKGFDYLRTTPMYNPIQSGERIWTYDVAVLIMALEANNVAKNSGGHTLVEKVNIKGDDLSWMRRLHSWLLQTRHEYTDAGLGKVDKSDKDGNIIESGAIAKAKKVAWRYPATREDPANVNGYDNSNTQYAILALKSCARCGIKTPKDVWFGILSHFLALQQDKGEEVARVGSDTQGGTFVSEFKDQARGWGYTGKTDPGSASIKSDYGSMTAGSIGSIIMARSEVLNDSSYPKKYASAVDKSVRDGLAWIAKNWTVTANPKSPIDSTSSWNLYYLYALERIGMLAQVRNIGDHFWYKEGAEHLCGAQRGDGSWAGPRRYSGEAWDIVNTDFALLFLKRATMIVIGTGFQEEKK